MVDQCPAQYYECVDCRGIRQTVDVVALRGRTIGGTQHATHEAMHGCSRIFGSCQHTSCDRGLVSVLQQVYEEPQHRCFCTKPRPDSLCHDFTRYRGWRDRSFPFDLAVQCS